MGRIYDVPINAVGKVQIEKRIPEIMSLAPEEIISSPLKRAEQSAQIVSEAFGLPIKFDDRVMEIDMGLLSGKANAEAAAMVGKSLEDFERAYRMGTYDYTALGGESAEEVVDRVQDFLSDLIERPAQSAVVVCHGGLMRTFYKVITGELYSVDRGMPNAELIVLDYESPS